MSKRQPVRGQVVKWCVCGDWFASERDEKEHRCPGPMYVMKSSEEDVFFKVLRRRAVKAKGDL